MTEIAFYHLEQSDLDSTLFLLLGKARAAGYRVVVRAGSGARVEALNLALWTLDPASFLPHGSARDGQAACQPIWLTAGTDTPNQATMLVAVDGVDALVSEDLSGYRRCLEIFDGRDPEALAKARAHWAACREQGHDLSYFRQDPSGGWSRQTL